jgi:NAD(P)-dependent dehydrogenase (short-subunit alcohol dehydrogenase family)
MAGRLLNHEKKIKAAGERHPLKRTGHPWDIAKAVEFLLSNDSTWMSGQTLNVDGGLSKLRI